MTTYVHRRPLVNRAIISADGLYRYTLSRVWLAFGPHATFVMLNPSTADADRDDATIRQCVALSKSWDMAALRVVNLYAYRSTDPKGLWKVEDPVGPENDRYLTIHSLLSKAQDSPLIAAWGNNAKKERVDEVLALPGMDRLMCLGKTKSGAPKHPLARGHHRIPRDFEPIPYP